MPREFALENRKTKESMMMSGELAEQISTIISKITMLIVTIKKETMNKRIYKKSRLV